jgi:uncharacterized protein YjbJ (UPF0337 family)
MLVLAVRLNRRSKERNRMNENQVKGTAKDVAGKAQEKLGDITDNGTQQAKGLARQAEGKVQKGIGNVQQSAQKAADDVQQNLDQSANQAGDNDRQQSRNQR